MSPKLKCYQKKLDLPSTLSGQSEFGTDCLGLVVSLKLPPPIGRARFENTMGNPFLERRFFRRNAQQKILEL